MFALQQAQRKGGKRQSATLVSMVGTISWADILSDQTHTQAKTLAAYPLALVQTSSFSEVNTHVNKSFAR